MGTPFGIAWRVWPAAIGVVVMGGCTTILGVNDDYRLVGAGGGSAGSTSSTATNSTATSSTATSSAGTGGSDCIPVDDQNLCTSDVCENGVPISKPTAAGSSCTMGGNQCDGLGVCVECLVATECMGNDTACQTRTCKQGKCGFDFAAAGTLLPTQPKQCTFAPAVNYPAGTGTYSVVAKDLNADGKPDIITANLSNNTVSVLINQGAGTFPAAVNYPVGAGPRVVVRADLNNDNKPDLVTANSAGNTVSVLLGNGNGTFVAAVSYAAGMTPSSVAIADLNGDTIPDLAVSNSGPKTVSVLLGVGNGIFAPR